MFPGWIGGLIPYVTASAGLLFLHNAWLAIVAYHCCIGAALIFSKRKIAIGQTPLESNLKTVLVTVVFGLTGGVLLYLFWPLLSVPRLDNYFVSVGLTSAAWPWFIAYYVTFNPVLEEFYWRGNLGSDASHPVASDFLFAGYHMVVLAGKLSIRLYGFIVRRVVLASNQAEYRKPVRPCSVSCRSRPGSH